MTDTTFVDKETVVTSSWLQDVNNLRYRTPSAGGGASLLPLNNGRTQLDKNSDNLNPVDIGAVANGTTDDSTIMNNALTQVGSSGKEIDLAGKSIYAPSMVNTFGVRCRHGKIRQNSVLPAASPIQVNTYADDVNGVMVGRENLAAFMLAVTSGVSNDIYIFGDSTVEMNSLYIPKADGLIKYALYEVGINWTNTINRGVSGTAWSDLNAIPDLSVNTKLIIIKYGINDAVKTNALSTLASDARTKLSAIRANANGAYDKLSILLMGPSSTYRPATGQGWDWYEDLRNIYLQLAKEFDCAYFDTYAWLQNTRRAPGMWLDQIAPDNGGIHPTPDAAWWIWYEGFKQNVFGSGTWNRLKSNHFWNRNGAVPNLTVYPTDQPQLFPMGITVDRATVANGWPADGTLITVRGGSSGNGGDVKQELTTLDVAPIKYMRTGQGLIWTQWTGDVRSLTLTNSWVQKDPSTYATVGYTLDDRGFVSCHGTITGGTLNTVFATLPSNVRPGKLHVFNVVGGFAGVGTPAPMATVYVYPNGNIEVYAASNSIITLDGIRFKVGA